jgi:hypothetical protein
VSPVRWWVPLPGPFAWSPRERAERRVTSVDVVLTIALLAPMCVAVVVALAVGLLYVFGKALVWVFDQLLFIVGDWAGEFDDRRRKLREQKEAKREACADDGHA